MSSGSGLIFTPIETSQVEILSAYNHGDEMATPSGSHAFAALNPGATSFVPLGAGQQSVARPVQRRRRTRRRPPPQEQTAESHTEEDWELSAQPLTQPGRPRGRRRQGACSETTNDDAWTVVPSEAGATEWSIPSVATTPWVSVAPSVAGSVDAGAVSAMADDDATCTTVDSTCTVCCERLGATDPAVCMKHCAHVFHRECLARWLQKHPSCPNCRTPTVPATVVQLTPLSAVSLAQLASGGCPPGTAGESLGPRGRGGSERDAAWARDAAEAAVAEAAAEARRTAEAWRGSVDLDWDAASQASYAPSLRSVTTARGWPQLAWPLVPPQPQPPLSYASAVLLSHAVETDIAAAATAAAAAAAASSCRSLALTPRRQARADPSAPTAGGTHIVQGRVLLAPRRPRLRAGAGGSRRKLAGPDHDGGALARVDEAEEPREGYEW